MADSRIQTQRLGVFQLTSKLAFWLQNGWQPPGHVCALYLDTLDATTGQAYDKGKRFAFTGSTHVNQQVIKLSMDT